MYLAFDFTIYPVQPASDILVAELAELGFESFVETDEGLQAFILQEKWEESLLTQVRALSQKDFQITYNRRVVAQQNWNAEWEKSFSPIKVGDHCLVRAPFHESRDVRYDIIIEPKMSFGTGHHETTYLMLEWLLQSDLSGLAVLDMGCGTGVLAILAAMKGAASVDAVDVDPWSYANTLENISKNGQDQIRVVQGDARVLVKNSYDVILANINRNILLEDIPLYAQSLTPSGVLLVSGFYLDDLSAISEKCREVNLKFQKNTVKNHWVSAKYVF